MGVENICGASATRPLEAFSKAGKAGIASGTSALRENVVELGAGLDALRNEIGKLEDALGRAACAEDAEGEILSSMKALRTTVDAMEKRVSDARWPLPKYRDMLFLY